MPERNIGEEILRGIRELKQGEHGCVTVVEDGTDDLYEIVDGKRVQLSNGPLCAWTVSLLAFPLGNFVSDKRLGWCLSHCLFHLPAPVHQYRRPDIAFVSYDRWARSRPLPNCEAWDVIPNLAIEVVSPADKPDELERKIAEYFRVGVVLVWVVYPLLGEIRVHESPTWIRVLTLGDVLEGGTVVPGFKLPLIVLFPAPDQSTPANVNVNENPSWKLGS